MTSFNLSKVVGAGVLVASLATLPLACQPLLKMELFAILLRLLLVIKLFMKPVKLIKVSVPLIGADRLTWFSRFGSVS